MKKESKFPTTAIQAIRYFAVPQNCHDFMVKMRWQDGVKCAHCGSKKVGKFSRKRLVSNCKDCKKQFSVKVGTIFEDSPLGLDKWLPAVWMIVNAKNGISSCELHRALGVTQKTAWYMGHRIRLALEKGSFRKMGGIVQVDESFIGGAARFMHKKAKERRGIVQGSQTHKSIVMGLLQRHNSKKGHSVIRAEVIPFVGRKEMLSKVRKYVLKSSEVHTDSASHYDELDQDFAHKVVDHAEAYVKDGVHTNGLENFWCLLKRSIKGTYVHYAAFHLHRYLGEQVYRFNERKDKDLGRFLMAVQGLIGKRLTYQKLIGKESPA